ncbi:retrovirus-related Pol polyprotein from transposon 297 [Trichonephila clavipes]|nr:retrovirus-related Pol polyprotein from transposon 297 [Trichonephila clavipes]
MSRNTCQLREGGCESLTSAQKEKFNLLLESFQNVFEPGGEAANILEHHINTGNSPPISVPPYIMFPVKKEILRKEIEYLLEKDIIEECEYPYGAPVVLIPKPNNQFRLCIDYRKLNEVTVPDTCPLPRMDDLLQEAKNTAYISTIDLKSGYHQVNVNPADRDKTAFVCPFETYRFKRMLFGLKNASATFQRLMDIFQRGLPVLAYLYDIIIMSPTFEQHLADLEAVFKLLMNFKLRANRQKCQFSCSRVKYLGLWITPQGIEVDLEKTSAILVIPPPKNVKQLQSFLQTCSWYRKCIANFSEIARSLSNLTKKKACWKWSEEEEKAFQTLKQCLVSPPILKQADFSKSFLIRTDASNYALEAVLLQGEDKEEHPVEFTSRLLNPAERNYSTTEREALAVVCALEKFRGYVDGASITVASDHQPLRWLMKLKSPTGRLARWALQLQSFNLNMEYIPRKSNVVADMLSRVERGYLMNQGVLFRYAPDSESEEIQLVVPNHERTLILKNHHDTPMAASNQKPSGLIQTPVPDQRFETLAIDLFGPLPESKDGKRWILIIKDCTTKWVELFALPNATAKECAITLIEENLLRYGIPRRLISDNGTQFVSAVMQQICYLLTIHQSLIPVYHLQANPVERKNRDLKPRLAILNDNFVPEITPYLKKFATFFTQIREVVEEQQDSRKVYANKKRKAAPTYQPGEHVFVASHPLSNAAQGRSAKLMPRRDGTYVILTQRSPSFYEIASLDNLGEPLGVYHTSALTPCNNDKVKPLIPLRKRGRPPKVLQTPGSSSGHRRN